MSYRLTESKLAAVAAKVDTANRIPTQWRLLLEYATTLELCNFSMGEHDDPEWVETFEEVRRRLQQRYRLRLGPQGGKGGRPRCVAKRENRDCICGEEAL